MNYRDLMSATRLMGQGMLAVFIVMAAISVIVYLLTRFWIKEIKK